VPLHPPFYDVIIVGAGPGGSAAAHGLAQQGLDVLLLDKADFPRDKTCGDALTPRALAVLADMGLLDEMERAGRRIHYVDIFAPQGHAVTTPIPKKDSLPGYALIVPRLILDNALRERAIAAGARFESPVHVTAVAPFSEQGKERGVLIRGEQRDRPVAFKARAAVIATGASTRLLWRMGLLRQAPPVTLAARAYLEGLAGLNDHMQIRFDGVPLPGYGWVFPLSDSAANVGAGFFRAGPATRHLPGTPRAAFEAFVQTAPLRRMLAGAHYAGPVKSYPIRMDFATAPTFGKRTLLIGEAAGLVNPLTGEGIDYALESGRLAARHLARGDLTRADLEAYDGLLRQRFQRLFIFCNQLRDLFLNPLWLNRMVSAAAQRPDLKLLLTDIVLGNRDVAEGMSVRVVLKTLLALVLR
jgi:geranylgeranyl reductase family protein